MTATAAFSSGMGAAAILVCLGLMACASPKKWRQSRQAEVNQASLTNAGAKDSPEERKKRKAAARTDEIRELDQLAQKLGARAQPVEAPCLDGGCRKRVLSRFFARLDELDKKKKGRVRVLHLGDSHIAADYVTRTIRDRLQDRFGDGGRGFIAVDQRAEYGGRRLERTNFRRYRIVDSDGLGRRYGVAAMHFEAQGAADATFKLFGEDDDVVIYHEVHPGGSNLKVFAEGELLQTFSTRGKQVTTKGTRVELPEHKLGDAVPPDWLKIATDGPGAVIHGISFESINPGLIYDAIGPVGADAAVYLELDGASFSAHLAALEPHLVVLMVGGNDALMVRSGKRSLADVKLHHQRLLERIKKAVPDAECLVWGPMDAADRQGNGYVSKTLIAEVRDLQREVATALGCGFWDTFAAMGGPGSFGRWLKAGIMNEDLVHPRAKGGDLLGHLFATALLNAYLNEE